MDKQENKTYEYYGEERLKDIFTEILNQKFMKEILKGKSNNEKE